MVFLIANCNAGLFFGRLAKVALLLLGKNDRAMGGQLR
jgi:hypothetical protein